MNYDLIILGAGPGGYLAAERAGHAGLKTLLIEKASLGGVCLNEGCIPSKTLLHSAKIFDYCNGYSAKYGVTCENPIIDHKAVIARKNKVVKILVSGVSSALKNCGVDVIKAEGVITGAENNHITVTASNEEYSAPHLIIATGSKAAVPPIPGLKEGLESGFVVTNREILDLQQKPESLVVIGGGVIGLEMASYYNSIGSKVTVVEMLPKIAGPNDDDISSILQKNYEKKGVTFHLNAKVTKISSSSVQFEKDGAVQELSCEKVLLSIGRQPVVSGFGLENSAVAVNRGAIVIDEKCKTNVDGIYAVGDCTGRSMLAHSAYRMADVAVNNILGRQDIMNYHAIPSVIYTNPEVAAVGLTESMALEKGIDFETIKIPMRFSGRYIAENEGGDGICKLIVDKASKTLVGAHIIGNPASEFIVACVMMIENKTQIEDIKKIIFPHPTVCEVIRDGLFLAE